MNRPAQHLRTDEEIGLYLSAALKDGDEDPEFVAHALGVVARVRDIGMSLADLHNALSNDGNPSFEAVMKMLKALRLKIQVVPA